MVRALGRHRLKDLGEPVELYQLGDAAFPPLRSLDSTNLPTQPTPLIGRERELAEAGRLLRAHRLVTLTGPGGSGKTRLALQLAADAVEDYPDRVVWVPLQSVRDAELVQPTVARALGRGTEDTLLVIDNFEQVLAAAPKVADLLAQFPKLKLLVTSREALRHRRRARVPGRAAARARGGQRSSPSGRPLRSRTSSRTKRSRRSAGASTAYRSRSSWRPHASRRSRPGNCSAVSTAGCRFSPVGHGTRRNDSRRCAPRSHGATSSSAPTSSEPSPAWPSSRAAARSTPPRRCARPGSTPSPPSSTRACSTARTTATSCSRRSASSRSSGSRRTATADDVRRRHAEHYLEQARSVERLIRSPQAARAVDELERDHGNLRAALGWLSDETSDQPLRLAVWGLAARLHGSGDLALDREESE